MFFSNPTQVEGLSLVKNNLDVRLEEKVEVDNGIEEKKEIKTKIRLRDDEEKRNTNEEFSIDGVVTGLNVSENSFVISGRTIVINSAKVPKFHQLGILTVGARVKVKGIIIDNVFYAENINVIGTGQGRFQIKEENSFMLDMQALFQQISLFFKQRLSFLSRN